MRTGFFVKRPQNHFFYGNADLSEQRKAKKGRKAKQLFREKGVRVLTKSHTKSNQEKQPLFAFGFRENARRGRTTTKESICLARDPAT